MGGGTHCPLAARGYSRDGKAGKAQIEYGLTCDPQGRPVAVEVFAGNTADPTAFISAAETVRARFGLTDVVIVGDRGMITTARIETLKAVGGLGWIRWLRAPAIRALAQPGALQMSLFDQANLAEITHPDYPDERLVACRNPALATERASKRQELLSATETDLARSKPPPRDRQPLQGKDKIALRVGNCQSAQDGQTFRADHHRRPLRLRPQDRPDRRRGRPRRHLRHPRLGPPQRGLEPARLVDAYKGLKVDEAGFRSLKTIDLDLRPIHHLTEPRVRSHIFICMLALYLVWHLRKAWAPMCFTDEDPPKRTDPVAPARRSAKTLAKASRQQDDQGTPIHSYATLLDELASLTRNTIAFSGGARITKLAIPTPLQRQAFELIGTPIPPQLNTP